MITPAHHYRFLLGCHLPVGCKVDGRALIARCEEALASLFLTRTHGVAALRVLPYRVVQPHAGVCICVAAVRVFECGVHPGKNAVSAWRRRRAFEVPHAMMLG